MRSTPFVRQPEQKIENCQCSVVAINLEISMIIGNKEYTLTVGTSTKEQSLEDSKDI